MKFIKISKLKYKRFKLSFGEYGPNEKSTHILKLPSNDDFD